MVAIGTSKMMDTSLTYFKKFPQRMEEKPLKGQLGLFSILVQHKGSLSID